MRPTQNDVQKAYRRAAKLQEIKASLEKQSDKEGWFGGASVSRASHRVAENENGG